VNLLPILTGQIKARACDWAAEGKGGAGGFREGEEERGERGKETEEDGGRWRKRTRKALEQSHNGLEKPQVQGISPNLGVQLINIVAELCVLCMGLLELDNNHNRRVLAYHV